MNHIGGELAVSDAQIENEYLEAIWFSSKGASAAYTLFWTLANIDEEKALSWFRITLDLTCKESLVRSRSDFHFVASLMLEQVVIRDYHVDLDMTAKLLKTITQVEEKEELRWL